MSLPLVGAGLSVDDATLPPSVVYDTSIGNGVDTAGFADLPLRSGAARYFVGNGGSDANTGLSHAQRFATLGKGGSLIVGGRGDQVLIAEGSTFTEDWGTETATYPTLNGGNSYSTKGGFSPLYPTVIQSYDPTDSLNESKYGRAIAGGNSPVFTGHQSATIGNSIDYFVVRGIKWNNTSTTVNQNFGMVGSCSYILFEGNYFKNTEIDVDSGNYTFPTTAPTSPTNLIFRNNVWDTPWDVTVLSGGNGRIGALYFNGYNGITWEDNFVYHNGWSQTQARTDVVPNQASTHPVYENPINTNFIMRRGLIIDPSADAAAIRGDGTLTETVVIGAPGGVGLGPPSSETGERSDGFDYRASYNLIIAGLEFNPGTGSYLGVGFSSNSGKPGSRTDHNLIIRKVAGQSRQGTVFNNFAWDTTKRCYMEFDHNISFDWSDTGYTVQTNGGFAPTYALPYTTYDYNGWDDPASGTNTHVTSASFTNAYTEAGLYVAAGYADKAALVAAMLANPTLHLQRTLRSLAFAGFNLPLNDAARADQTAPVLSLPTGTSTVAGTADIGATTNEGNGKLYYILSASATPPHPSQIKMGVLADHSAAPKAGFIAVSSTGAKTANLTSVAAGTYYAHLMHEDAASNKSNIVTSSSITVAAAGGGGTAVFAPATDYTRTNGNLTTQRTANTTGSSYSDLADTARVNGTFIFHIDALQATGSTFIGLHTGGLTNDFPGHGFTGNGIGYNVSTGDIWFYGGPQTTVATATVGDNIKVGKAANNISFYKQTGGAGAYNLLVTINADSPGYGTPPAPVSGAAYPVVSGFSGFDFGSKVTADFSGW
jgi:hypothetical protein